MEIVVAYLFVLSCISTIAKINVAEVYKYFVYRVWLIVDVNLKR